MTLLKRIFKPEVCHRATIICAVSILSIFGAGCGQKSAIHNEKTQVLDALAANDPSKVRLLLPKQGSPDFGEASYKELLNIAADKFAKAAGPPAARQWVPAITELSRHLRHIIGKPIVVTGKIEVNLAAQGETPLAACSKTYPEVAELLRRHGGHE